MKILILLALNMQCFVSYIHTLSGIEIKPKLGVVKTRKAPKRRIKYLVKTWMKESESLDPRLLSVAYLESRLRLGVRRGDRGKACGLYQIHARHSYPLFKRRRGYVGWVESDNTAQINQECRSLERTHYAMKTMEKLLALMDKRDLHPCHHNSGIYGQCNSWYRERLNVVTAYVYLSKTLCQERIEPMAMTRTATPPKTPTQKVQGYLDSMAGKPRESEDPVYVEGYELAEKVKRGEEKAPLWAV